MPVSSLRPAVDPRYALKLDPGLGAGNFLRHASRVNANRDVALITTDRPFVLPGGGLGQTVSIVELQAIADRYATWYVAQGIARMDPVAVYVADGLQALIQFVALTSIGAIAAITNGAMPAAVAAMHVRRIGAVAVVTDRGHHAALARELAPDAVRWLACLEDVPDADPAKLPPWFPFRHDAGDPVMISHSSGTTGVPKPVPLDHGGWFHGIRHLLGQEPAAGAERMLSALPASHNAAIAYAIHAILSDAALMVLADVSGPGVARAIEAFRPGTVVAFPQTYVGLATLDRQAHDLASVTTWVNSGDAAHERHIRRLLETGHHLRGGERLAGSQFVDGLGSSEMGHSSFRILHTPSTDSYDRCVGRPLDWVEAAVLDDDGRALPAGRVGRLGVRSPSVTPGYWNNSALSARSRCAGYWLTGDLVYRDAFGCYVHVDRVPDAIPTPHGPLYSLQTEELILKHEPLIDCTVIAAGAADPTDAAGVLRGADRAWPAPVALLAPEPGRAIDPDRMLDAINRRQRELGRPALARALVVEPGAIPVGITGKVLKRQLRERFRGDPTGGFDGAATAAGRIRAA